MKPCEWRDFENLVNFRDFLKLVSCLCPAAYCDYLYNCLSLKELPLQVECFSLEKEIVGQHKCIFLKSIPSSLFLYTFQPSLVSCFQKVNPKLFKVYTFYVEQPSCRFLFPRFPSNNLVTYGYLIDTQT